jgi:hypothetical protein
MLSVHRQDKDEMRHFETHNILLYCSRSGVFMLSSDPNWKPKPARRRIRTTITMLSRAKASHGRTDLLR